MMRLQLLLPRHFAVLGPRHVQSVLDHARHHDGLLRGHADPDRHGQLSGAADDRRPRHGVSPPERLQLLDLRSGGVPDVLQFPDRQRPRHRLVRLRSATRSTPFPAAPAPITGSSACWSAASALPTAGINFVATILCMRGPGMTLGKLPLFVWMMLWTLVLILVAIPPFTAALVMLLFDRHLGTHFFDTQRAARPCYGNTCSGSSAIPRSTS